LISSGRPSIAPPMSPPTEAIRSIAIGTGTIRAAPPYAVRTASSNSRADTGRGWATKIVSRSTLLSSAATIVRVRSAM